MNGDYLGMLAEQLDFYVIVFYHQICFSLGFIWIDSLMKHLYLCGRGSYYMMTTTPQSFLARW